LDDLITVMEYLCSTKTLTGRAAEAMERLRERAASRDFVRVDVVMPKPENDAT
jgi:hypothetical protein